MTRVLLLTTGGTIASRRGDQGLEPQISARGLLEYMSDLRAHMFRQNMITTQEN